MSMNSTICSSAKASIPGWIKSISKVARNGHRPYAMRFALATWCLFASSSSINKEGYLQKEIRHVLDVADEKAEGTIYVIPVRLEGCEIPPQLRRWQWVDLFEADRYERLMRSLRARASGLPTAARH